MYSLQIDRYLLYARGTCIRYKMQIILLLCMESLQENIRSLNDAIFVIISVHQIYHTFG